jgi:hypothetical protein
MSLLREGHIIKKIKGFLYNCDRDNIEQTITFDEIDNRIVDLDKYL